MCSFKNKSLLFLIFFLWLLLFEKPALSWNCDVHIGLELLSDLSLYPGTEVPVKDIPNYDLKEKCKNYTAPPSKRPDRLRPYECKGHIVFEDLVYGSKDPDVFKNNNLSRMLSHDIDAVKRAKDAFNAAIKAYEKGDYCGFRYSAPRQLAHSFHYIEDLGDPSRERTSLRGLIDRGGLGGYKRDFMGLSDVTVKLLVKKKLPGDLTNFYHYELNKAKREMRDKNIDGIINKLGESRRGERAQIRKIYKTSRADKEYLLKKHTLKSFALIVAAKERLIVLFNYQCQSMSPLKTNELSCKVAKESLKIEGTHAQYGSGLKGIYRYDQWEVIFELRNLTDSDMYFDYKTTQAIEESSRGDGVSVKRKANIKGGLGAGESAKFGVRVNVPTDPKAINKKGFYQFIQTGKDMTGDSLMCECYWEK